MKEQKNIQKDYYQNIASQYDESRFGNSYGRYIHLQEYQILSRLLPAMNKKNYREDKILDMACGTGRFLGFANHGLDISENMLAVAKDKYPDKSLLIGDVTDLPYQNQSFSTVFSFHLLMHLSQEQTMKAIKEVHRILQKGGTFIFDIPSKKRRQLFGHQQSNWHGANAFTSKEILELTKNGFDLKYAQGILFFPVHRLPDKARNYFRGLDTFLCRTFVKEYASYMLFCLKKK